MKRFIVKSALFTVPFYILFTITYIFYSKTEGPDLLRLGFVPNIYKSYRSVFKKAEGIKYAKLSTTKNRTFKVMTIGDSFSAQGANGYTNFLAEDFSVLYVDHYISKNPIQMLRNLTNGFFFDYYNVKFVILENVERHLIDNSQNVEPNKINTLNDLNLLIKTQKNDPKTYKYDFFSRTTLEFPLYYMPKYFLSSNYLSNNLVYNYDLNNNIAFSNFSNKLLFYHVDLIKTKQNNDLGNCIKLNDTLNDISLELKKKNIQLIFLPAPDKYDLYYDLIAENKNLPKPYFFDNFSSLKKEYLYIDTKSLLQEHIYDSTDLYFYDDTHWSPVASKIISNRIKEIINQNDKSINTQLALDSIAHDTFN